MKKLLGIVVLGLFFFILKSYAHQPILNEENPISINSAYVIEKPEVSKAIYSTLNGQPHIYKVSSDKKFKFYVGITVPKIDGCNNFKTFSFQILDGNLNLIKEFDGENFKWWAWYEKYGKKWYWIGPEFGRNFKSINMFPPGDYFIKVFNHNNKGNYVLATGDIEKFGLLVIAKMPIIMPKINKRFWEVDCES